MTKFIFQEAEKVNFADKFLAATFLRLIPKKITPNHITVIRFIATPFVAFLMIYEHYIIGLVAFLLVAFTDAIDGAMARTRDQVSEWGKVYDPLADKVLIGTMVFVVVLKYIDFWAAMIIIGLELIIITAAWLRKMEGGKVEANWWGKIKMMLQVAGVTILLFAAVFNWAALIPMASGILYLAIAFAVVSLLTHGI